MSKEKIKVRTNTGTILEIDAVFINDYEENSKIFYCQDKLIITDDNNVIVDSLDIISIISVLRERFNEYNIHLQSQTES